MDESPHTPFPLLTLDLYFYFYFICCSPRYFFFGGRRVGNLFFVSEMERQGRYSRSRRKKALLFLHCTLFSTSTYGRIKAAIFFFCFFFLLSLSPTSLFPSPPFRLRPSFLRENFIFQKSEKKKKGEAILHRKPNVVSHYRFPLSPTFFSSACVRR